MPSFRFFAPSHASAARPCPNDRTIVDESSSLDNTSSTPPIQRPGFGRSPHFRSRSHHLALGSAQHPLSTSYPEPAVSLRRSEGDLFASLDVNIDGAPEGMLTPPRRTVAGNMARDGAELTTGQCLCCDSTVRWPSNLTNFRCTVCMTVNDLKAPKPAALSADEDGKTSHSPATLISISAAQDILRSSERDFIARLKQPQRVREKQTPPPSTEEPPREDRERAIPSEDDWKLPPSRPPPPPPSGKDPRDASSRISQDEERRKQSPYMALASSMFRPLETYIQSTFNRWECLNASFPEFSPTANNERQTGKDSSPNTGQDSGGIEIPVTEQPGERETLMLTVGRATVRREKINPHAERKRSGHERRPSSRTPPGIDWKSVRVFYDLLLNSGKNIVPTLLSERELSGFKEFLPPSPEEPQLDLNQLEFAINEARVDMLNVLLRTTETILKRPGRPLKRSNDIHFLLIILMNPLLSPGAARLTAHSSIAIPPMSRSPPNVGPPAISSSRRRSHSRGPSSTPSSHSSSILKRVFGLLSNLPNECHHFLVTWLSVMPQPLFAELVELGGSFTTHRILRNDAKRTARGNNNMRGKLPYSDDWQIKAVARVMSLLFYANNNAPRRRHQALGAFSEDAENAGIALTQEARRRGQILPISAFYNMRLDYSDIIADFDAWEAKGSRFCFCQYPFYISMGTKIQILEHDAQRQMHVQARHAFITNISNRTAISQYMTLRVRRDCLVEDSLKGIGESVGAIDDVKKLLRIEFVGEDGIDAGGLKKEWFLMVARDVFDPNLGLFIYEEDSNYCYFNPFSFESSEQFYLVGVLLGLAVYNSTILDIALPPYIFRKLMHFAPQYVKGAAVSADTRPRPPFRRTLEDLAVLRPGLARGLQQLLDFDGDVQTIFCRDFVVEVDRYGEKALIPLCPGGETRPVTNANRNEFVDLLLQYILDSSVSRQFEPFKRGFYMVCGGNALSLFAPDEIELLVRGSAEPLDVQALKAVAIYDGWGSQSPPRELDTVVKWFWNFFERISATEQRQLLSFITGSDRIPATGATSLIIKVVCLGQDCNRFPVARTCFNQISLWRYKQREKFERMLWTAVTESEGFGLK